MKGLTSEGMVEFEKILTPGERVLWEGKPEFKPYYASLVVPSILTPVMLAPLFILPFLWISFALSKGTEGPFGKLFFFLALAFSSPFLLIGAWKLLCNPIYRVLEHRVLHYAITNKRVILQKGVIGRDFTSIDLDKIERMEVHVNAWDALFRRNTGTLTLFTTTVPYFLRNIPDPYGTFTKLQELSQGT